MPSGFHLVVRLDEKHFAHRLIGIVGRDEQEGVFFVDARKVKEIRLLSEGIEFVAIARHGFVGGEDGHRFGWQLRRKIRPVADEKPIGNGSVHGA